MIITESEALVWWGMYLGCRAGRRQLATMRKIHNGHELWIVRERSPKSKKEDLDFRNSISMSWRLAENPTIHLGLRRFLVDEIITFFLLSLHNSISNNSCSDWFQGTISSRSTINSQSIIFLLYIPKQLFHSLTNSWFWFLRFVISCDLPETILAIWASIQ